MDFLINHVLSINYRPRGSWTCLQKEDQSSVNTKDVKFQKEFTQQENYSKKDRDDRILLGTKQLKEGGKSLFSKEILKTM